VKWESQDAFAAGGTEVPRYRKMDGIASPVLHSAHNQVFNV
jgi:hypothetical protein